MRVLGWCCMEGTDHLGVRAGGTIARHPVRTDTLLEEPARVPVHPPPGRSLVALGRPVEVAGSVRIRDLGDCRTDLA